MLTDSKRPKTEMRSSQKQKFQAAKTRNAKRSKTENMKTMAKAF